MNIGVRYYPNNNYIDWILPCYKGITKQDKIKLQDTTHEINIVCIGSSYTQYSNLNVELILKKYINNFDDINFHLIARKIEIKEYSKNIFIYELCNTSLMIDILKKCDYVFCFDTNIDQYINNKLSASIPLSFNFGCRLILPEKWKKSYLFKSAISYSENEKINLQKNLIFDDIYNELDTFIYHRNVIIEMLFSCIFYFFCHSYNFLRKHLMLHFQMLCSI